MNKKLILITLFLITGCSPKGLILINKEANEEIPVSVAVLDFHNHSNTSNPRIGRELAERLSYNIFAYSKGSMRIIERIFIKSELEKVGLKFSDTFSKEELLALAESIKVDFIIKGTVIDYTTDIMDENENVLEVLVSIISSKDGSTIGMLKLRKEEEYCKDLVYFVSDEAGRMIVNEKIHLQNVLKPVTPDTANAQ